jgi:hypothetical protein
MQTEAEQVADWCLESTGTKRFGKHARSVALVAIMLLPDGELDLPSYRKQVRAECRRRKQEFGSVFLIFILPLIINIITAWIARWLVDRRSDSQLRRIRGQAFDAL